MVNCKNIKTYIFNHKGHKDLHKVHRDLAEIFVSFVPPLCSLWLSEINKIYFPRSWNSVRRLAARPSSVLLAATGLSGPFPTMMNLLGSKL